MGIWKHDKILKSLGSRDDAIGALVRAFPGADAATESGEWLQSWFREQIQGIVDGSPLPSADITAGEAGEVVSVLERRPVDERLRFISVAAKYFRGFREPHSRIDLDADLLVVVGSNSTGKTSLTEALEWVLTGQLSRRESGYGHPRELEKCIANEFCPPDVRPLVELELAVGGERHVLRRELIADYGPTRTSTPETLTYLDGRELSQAEDAEFLERVFAGVPPFLMQHTLRRFVYADPTDRRRYFERLLQIDELTGLISKAVLRASDAESITSPSGGEAQRSLSELQSLLSGALSPSILSNALRSPPSDLRSSLRTALQQIARSEFEGIPAESSLGEILMLLEGRQRDRRDKELPALAALRASVTLPVRREVLEDMLPSADRLSDLATSFAEAESARQSLAKADRVIAYAAARLADVGLIETRPTDNVTCPMCLAAPPTLSPPRLEAMLALRPLLAAADEAGLNWQEVCREVEQELTTLVAEVSRSLPHLPEELHEEPRYREELDRIVTVRTAAEAPLGRLLDAVEEFRAALESPMQHRSIDAWQLVGQQILNPLEEIAQSAAEFRTAVAELEAVVSAQALEDDGYRRGQAWIRVSRDIPAIMANLHWQRAKGEVTQFLTRVREGLIELRGRFIEGARARFSEDMNSTWNMLRADKSSAFDRLEIPPARGRGFKLEFEVVARLDGGGVTREVNALKVFSESQANVVGIAAYVTRGKRLGHSVLVMDDPVQSMDRDHFNTFASSFLNTLLADGYQIMILTHNEEFEERISYHHFDKDGYCTLKTRRSRKTGCHVEEGSRRVVERLKVAEDLADDGRDDDAWIRIRLAIERLYTIVKCKTDFNFDPTTWRGMDARYMWEEGVGEVINSTAPDAAPRLRQILTFAAAGPHDRAALGETDLRESIDFLRRLTNQKLQLGNG